MLLGKRKGNLYFYQMSWSTNFKVLSLVLLKFIDSIHESNFMLRRKNSFSLQKYYERKCEILCVDKN